MRVFSLHGIDRWLISILLCFVSLTGCSVEATRGIEGKNVPASIDNLGPEFVSRSAASLCDPDKREKIIVERSAEVHKEACEITCDARESSCRCPTVWDHLAICDTGKTRTKGSSFSITLTTSFGSDGTRIHLAFGKNLSSPTLPPGPICVRPEALDQAKEDANRYRNFYAAIKFDKLCNGTAEWATRSSIPSLVIRNIDGTFDTIFAYEIDDDGHIHGVPQELVDAGITAFRFVDEQGNTLVATIDPAEASLIASRPTTGSNP